MAEKNNPKQVLVKIGNKTSRLDIVIENSVEIIDGGISQERSTIQYHQPIGHTLRKKMIENDKGEIWLTNIDLLDNADAVKR